MAKDLSGGHAHRTLFEHLDLTVAPGDVVGVVGANGAGKTTLLRLLAGESAPLAGTVTTAPCDAFVGWLPQEHERLPGETVAGYIARRTGATAATLAMEAAATALGDESAPGADDGIRHRPGPLARQRGRRISRTASPRRSPSWDSTSAPTP